ncbi:hypothetical protein [uncultured Williamsia sp.]|uniref:hypothetical protein n=1 Tax=uncultured Williamsia sp. TaxID=259311 RepID=UPI00260E5226|nr:hypothetical protein [uncultured Williamsia sp.]
MGVNVQPEVLHQAAKGINGVIDGLSGTPVIGAYAGQTGRGFNDLALSGEQMSRPEAKAAMDDFCERWEWGMRALVQTANDIAHHLNLGAGMYENQEKYNADALRDFANDLVGDPSLQKESVRDGDGNIVVKGTDDMSAGELVDYNRDRLTHPDVSAESFAAVKDDVENNLKSAAGDIPQALGNVSAVGTANALSGG